MFLIRKKIFDENGEEVEPEEEELEEGEEKSYEGYIPDDAIFPQNIITLNGEDKYLI